MPFRPTHLSLPMQAAMDLIHRAADTSLPVLITGESGTGKGVLTRTLHLLGPHSAQPYVPINVSAIPQSLFHAELFGAEAGAFTGATARRSGYLERAAGGMIVLNEIGDLTSDQQAAVLRVLQTRTYTRLGGNESQPVRARIVATTGVDLLGRVAEGRFREDLYHRLAVIYVPVPPLRERLGEISSLVRNLLAEGAESWGLSTLIEVTPDAIEELQRYHWPGNIRELSNVLTRLALGSIDGTIAGAQVRAHLAAMRQSQAPPPRQGAGRTLDETIALAIREALAENGGNVCAAAEALGISRATVYRRLKRAAPTA